MGARAFKRALLCWSLSCVLLLGLRFSSAFFFTFLYFLFYSRTRYSSALFFFRVYIFVRSPRFIYINSRPMTTTRRADKKESHLHFKFFSLTRRANDFLWFFFFFHRFVHREFIYREWLHIYFSISRILSWPSNSFFLPNLARSHSYTCSILAFNYTQTIQPWSGHKSFVLNILNPQNTHNKQPADTEADVVCISKRPPHSSFFQSFSLALDDMWICYECRK